MSNKDKTNIDIYVMYYKDKTKTCVCNANNPLCNYGIEGKCQRTKVNINPYSCVKE